MSEAFLIAFMFLMLIDFFQVYLAFYDLKAKISISYILALITRDFIDHHSKPFKK